MLYALPVLDDADHRVMSQVAKMHRKLRYELAQPRPWYGQLRREMRARAIRGSCAIDGHAVSLDDAEDVVIGAVPLGSVPAEVVGYRDALRYVHQLVEDLSFRYDRTLLAALHFLVLGPRSAPYPLRQRTGPGDGEYEAPEPYEARCLAGELVDWLNDGDTNEPALVRAAVAHLNLAGIGLWETGNGRVARCLQNLVLMAGGGLTAEFGGIEEWLGGNPPEYADALAAATGKSWAPAAGDTATWVRFCLRAHHLQMLAFRARFQEYAALWPALAERAAAANLPDRAVAALFTAARGARVRPGTYQHDAAITPQQAHQDLRQLADQNLLVPHPHHYTAAPARHGGDHREGVASRSSPATKAR